MARAEEPVAVSVVVPTHNRADLLSRLLAALDVQDYPDFEVIIVDDASTDATAAVLAAWTGPKRHVIRQEHPDGSYAARNLGWRTSIGAIIAFIDDDCIPEPGWLSAHIRTFDDGIVGVQGMTVASPGEITPFTHQIDQRRGGQPYRTCNISYRRSILEELDGFDGTIRWNGDDVFGLRARLLGTIAFTSDAVVRHPPRPREWRTEAQWLDRFRADETHRRVLRELGEEFVTPPGKLLPIVLWFVRPLVRQTIPHFTYAVRHPHRYLSQIRPMAGEKIALLRALRSREDTQPAPLPSIPASVIVVTKHRSDLLADALTSLRRQTYDDPPVELIVVDNGPDDATRRVAETAGARYVPAPGMTLGAARQAGLAATSGEIVAFTDDDCRPDDRWLESLVRTLVERIDALGVQGKTVTERGSLLSHGVRVVRAGALFHTCNIAYRRAALDRAGGFDERFVGWFEDTALGARVSRRGPIAFAPDALVIHRAMPLVPLDRDRWSLLLTDERHLASFYPDFYRRARGPGFWAVVVGRWLIGSPLKRLVRALPALITSPRDYLTLITILVKERRELLIAAVNLARKDT